MDLVVDANILFSGLIAKSLTTSLLFEPDLHLYAPEFTIIEFMKYEEVILKKTKRTREEFIQLLHALQQVISVVPQVEYKQFMKKAYAIAPDKNDTVYFALALKLRCAIWSNDKALKNQDKVEVLTTVEVMNEIINTKD